MHLRVDAALGHELEAADLVVVVHLELHRRPPEVLLRREEVLAPRLRRVPLVRVGGVERDRLRLVGDDEEHLGVDRLVRLHVEQQLARDEDLAHVLAQRVDALIWHGGVAARTRLVGLAAGAAHAVRLPADRGDARAAVRAVHFALLVIEHVEPVARAIVVDATHDVDAVVEHGEHREVRVVVGVGDAAHRVVGDRVPQRRVVGVVAHLDLTTIDGQSVHHSLAHARVKDDAAVPLLVAVPVELDDCARREDVVRCHLQRVVPAHRRDVVEHGRHGAEERDGEAHGELRGVHLLPLRHVVAVVVGADRRAVADRAWG